MLVRRTGRMYLLVLHKGRYAEDISAFKTGKRVHRPYNGGSTHRLNVGSSSTRLHGAMSHKAVILDNLPLLESSQVYGLCIIRTIILYMAEVLKL